MMRDSIHERLYRTDLASFTKLAFNELHSQHALDTSWHIDVMADALQGCLDRRTSRLILNAPPRSFKSHCASVATVVFALGRDPTCKIIVGAGTRGLAAELQRRAIALMRNQRCRALFPHLRPTVTLGEIVLPHGGGILYTAVGQSLIGRGADLIVIDDPISPHRAQDDAEREGVNAWYDAEIVPRLNDKSGGAIILVMQRVHRDDLTAHVRKSGVWTEVVLPAIALKDEAWRLHERRTVIRRKGEPLLPDREGQEILTAILHEVGAYNFRAQYLQQPSRAPGLERVGWFWAPRPPDWQPGMSMGGAFRKVREIDALEFEVFGVGEPPPHTSKIPYSDAEWEAHAIIQQRRLVAEAQGDRSRLEAQGL
ncbi:hypothetical protein [Methylobacterium longum]|uniref:Terminase n=1 Tax=Methylobacterium longum TaxID=767694 RepID=A0ABT8AVV6_9HYPH|nr:hypothetical protein [Methylobacterium longum]MDN3573919.1 hypothetical protein [Methylobacterium longum]GJE13598.1 hypothetical protein FOHLNKBM_4662 [Methylobacterium longum]